MSEKFFEKKENVFTKFDLEKSSNEFKEAEDQLNSINENDFSTDNHDALKVYKNWKEKRQKYFEIYNSLNQKK